MINSLSFDHFKSWKEFPKTDFGQITGFFGTNSSGKTSLLDFLLLIKQTLESTDRSQVLEVGDEGSYTQLGSFADLIYSHDESLDLSMELALKLNKPLVLSDIEERKKELGRGSEIVFRSEISQTPEKRLYVKSFDYEFEDTLFRFKKIKEDRYDYSLEVEPEINIKRTVGRKSPLPEPSKFHGFPDQIKTYYQNAGFILDLQLAFENFFKNIYYLGPLREYPKRQYIWSGTQPHDMGPKGERSIEALLSSRTISPGPNKWKRPVEYYVAKWLKKLGLIHSFHIVELAEGSNIFTAKVKRNPKSSEVSITDVGFGVSQILPVLTLCYYVPEGSIVLIEQPEIHLHPKVQSGLADVFIDAVKVKKIQIIMESHSEHLLTRFQRRIAEETLNNEEFKAYFCENTSDESRLTKLDVDMFGHIKNWPDDFFGDEMGEYAEMSRAIQKRMGVQ